MHSCANPVLAWASMSEADETVRLTARPSMVEVPRFTLKVIAGPQKGKAWTIRTGHEGSELVWKGVLP